MYLLVKWHIEGIENLIYLSDSKELIITEYKKVINNEIKDEKDSIKYLNEEFPSLKPLKFDIEKVVDRFCIMQWSVVMKEFYNVTKELKIKI